MTVRKLAIFAAAILVLSLPALADSVLYTQPFDGTGNAYSSQNDTAGFGLFAQVFDNYKYVTAAGTYTVTNVQFTGEYFNPPNQGPITAWTVNFYADAGGQPGALVYGVNVAGTGNETFFGNVGGFPTYTYSIATNFANAVSGTTYWLSVYPDLAFPPQWGWSSGLGGDGVSYQIFNGAPGFLSVDMAFTLNGHDNQVVPEPGIILMMGSGALGVMGVLRRKLF